MPAFALPEPELPFAATLPSVILHTILIAGAVWVTRATSKALVDPGIPIDMQWSVPAATPHAVPTTSPALPGAPTLSTPIPDIPIAALLSGIPDPLHLVPIGAVTGDPPPTSGFPVGDPTSATAILEESAVDDPPTLLMAGRQRYPVVLAEAGISGSVTLSYVIDQEGRVEPEGMEVVSASNAGFIPAAKEMALTSRFRPARKGGAPVRVRVRQKIGFRH